MWGENAPLEQKGKYTKRWRKNSAGTRRKNTQRDGTKILLEQVEKYMKRWCENSSKTRRKKTQRDGAKIFLEQGGKIHEEMVREFF